MIRRKFVADDTVLHGLFLPLKKACRHEHHSSIMFEKKLGVPFCLATAFSSIRREGADNQGSCGK